VIAIGLCACSVTAPDGDPFPIHVDTSQGPVLVHVAEPGQPPVAATLDVLAPFTLMDPGTGVPVQTVSTELLLFGETTAGATTLVERAHFSASVVLLHPCDPSAPSCTVGQPNAPTPIDAVMGADTVTSSAIRFDFPNSDVFVFPGIAGADVLRDQECDARFPGPFQGGGTLVLGGADVGFAGRRIAIGACMGTAPSATPALSGTDALFVFSTGVGPTILGATPYARYCEVPANGCNPDATTLPAATVLLTSGPVTGHLASISNLTLVANPSGTSRGPCGDLFASVCLPDTTCAATEPGLALCKNRSPCGAPAVVQLTPPVTTPIPIVVVSDDDPTLQALRAELRPDQPEVDGVLGVDAVRALQLDVDYPNNRLLMRCGAGQAGCAVRRTLASVDQAYQLTDTTGRGCGEPP
jgi:hypothetical protein